MMLKGSCLCKAVTYTLDEELSELVFCHCSFCRKATASAYQENIPEVCALKLGTIDECNQNLQTVPKRHIFQDPAFSWLLDK